MCGLCELKSRLKFWHGFAYFILRTNRFAFRQSNGHLALGEPIIKVIMAPAGFRVSGAGGMLHEMIESRWTFRHGFAYFF